MKILLMAEGISDQARQTGHCSWYNHEGSVCFSALILRTARQN